MFSKTKPDTDPAVLAGIAGKKVPDLVYQAAAKVQDALAEAVEHGQHDTADELAPIWYTLEELCERDRELKKEHAAWKERQGQ